MTRCPRIENRRGIIASGQCDAHGAPLQSPTLALDRPERFCQPACDLDAQNVPEKDSHRAASTTWPSRRRWSRAPTASRRGSATRSCSSARTCSRCSRSSCAAPTTRWRSSTRRRCARGVIAASAGNHAQGVALARSRARHQGGDRHAAHHPGDQGRARCARSAREVVLHGDAFDEAYAHAAQLASREGLTFVHPYDDPDVIAGQGTIGMEILRQQPGAARRDLRAGRRRRPDRRHRRLRQDAAPGDQGHRRRAGRRRRHARGAGRRRAGGARPGRPVRRRRGGDAGRRGDLPHLRAVRRRGGHSSTTDEICAAIKDIFEDTRSIAEPAGALPLAGLKKYVAARAASAAQTLVAIDSGANMNFDRLRYVAERAEIGEQREALLAVTIPEQPGSFRRSASARQARASPSSTTATPTPERGAHLRRRADRSRRRRARAAGRPCSREQGYRGARPDRQRAGQAAHPPHGRRPRPRRGRRACCTASSFPSAPARC